MRFEHWIYTWPLRWRSVWRRHQVEQELEDEIRDHLETQIERQVAAGVDRDEARERVRRAFGGVEQAKEQCRDARRVGLIDTLVLDLRYGGRALRRAPGFAVAAILTLALGIGANTAIFSLVDGVLLSPLPYPASDRLVSVTATYPGGAFAALRDQMASFEAATYAEGQSFTLTGQGVPVRVAGTRVSAELFSVLGVSPALGRWLRPGEDAVARDRVVVLSHEIWESRFGRDERIVGKLITLDDVMREVVAVMPPAFRFPSVRTQVWVPLRLDPRDRVRHWAGDFMPVVGRLREGMTREQAQADVRAFQSGVRALFPWPMPNDWNRDLAVVPLKDALVGDVRLRLLILVAAVAIVLVIACANVANLSLSRAATREREMAIRAAMGAGPRRIARQLLTESVLLASMGGVAGLLVGVQALGVLKRVLPPDTPRLADVHLNGRVLVFAAVLALLAGLASGLAPVLQVLRLRLRAAMDSGGRGGGGAVAGRLRSALTIAQVASAMLLVVTAGLLVRSLWTLSRADPGFSADGVMTAVIAPSESLCAVPARCLAAYRALEDAVQAAPGIAAAAWINTPPLTGAVAKRSLDVEGVAPDGDTSAPLVWLHVVSHDYLRVMDIRLESGRAFTREDMSGGAPVAMVPASTARALWPGQSPLGRHVRFVGEPHWHTIVGVVADVRAHDLTRSVPSYMDGALYVPHGPRATMEGGQLPPVMTLTLRTLLAEPQVAALVRRLAAGVSGDIVVGEVRSMRAVVAAAAAAPAATASLLVTIAALALALGCIGVYGVLSFLVSRRARDLGIRLALGAQRRDVFWLVISEGATLCATGIAAGVAGAVVLTRWLASELHGVSATDPATYGAVAAVVAGVTLVACYVPTRRAMRVDPLIVLRDS